MGDLREKVERHLKTTLEGRFSLPVELTSPAGVAQTHSKNDPETLLRGQILYDTIEENPETGQEVILEDPVVTLRRSSLDRIPESGEAWFVRIPKEPKEDAEKESLVLSDLPVQGGRSIGFIRLYLTRPKQSQ